MNSLTCLLSLSVLTAAPAAPPTTLAKDSLLRAIPENPALYFGAWDLDKMRSTSESSAWYRFFRDEQMQKLVNTMTSFFEEAMAESGDAPDLPFELSEICDSLRGSVAGFMQLHPEDETVVAGLFVEPGESRGQFEDLFDKFIELVSEEIEPTTDTYGQAELTQFEMPDSEGNMTFLDSETLMGFILSNEPDFLLETVHGAIDRYTGQDASEGFAGSTTLSEARRSSTGNVDFEFLFDAAPIIDMMLAEESPTEKELQLMQSIGVTSLRWAYGTAGIGKGEAFDVSLAMHVPPSSMISEFVDLIGPAPVELLKQMPANSQSVSISRFDIQGLYSLIMEGVREFDDAAYQQANGMIQMVGAMNGIDIEQDLLSQFNGNFASFVVEAETTETPSAWNEMMMGMELGGTVLIGLTDGVEFETFVMDLLANFGLDEMIDTETFQGADIHSVEFGEGAPSLHFTFTKNAFVYSMAPDPIREVVRMQGQEDIPSAFDNKDLRALAGSLSGVGAFSLTDTRSMVETTLSTFASLGNLMGMSGMEDNPLGYLPWPDSSIAGEYFKGEIVSTVHRVGDTLRLHTWSK